MLKYDFNIDRNIFRPGTEMFITKRTLNGLFLAKIDWIDVGLDARVKDERDEPTLIVHHARNGEADDSGKQFLEQMWQQIGQVLGKDEKDPKVEGLQATLGAQEKHLEDMRKLVFERDKT